MSACSTPLSAVLADEHSESIIAEVSGTHWAESAPACVNCIACQEEIKPGASKCPRCQAFQQPWKNRLPLFGAVVALLTFVGSVVALIAATATDAFASLSWNDDVTVISFATSGPIVVRNTGSGAVFLEHVSTRSEETDYRSLEQIGALVERDTFASTGDKNSLTGGIVAGVPEAAWKRMLDRQIDGVTPYIFSRGHPQLESARQHLNESLREFNASCTLAYRTTRSLAPVEKEFECVGVFLQT